MPKRAKVVSTVKSGGISIDVRQYSSGLYGFEITPPNSLPVRVRLSSLEAAEEEANKVIGQTQAGRLDLMSIDPAEFVEFLQWKQRQVKSAPVPKVVESFLASKRTKGRSSKHIRGLEYTLTKFAKDFKGTVEALDAAAVEQWLDSRNVGPRRWNNLHADIVSLVRYARRHRLIGADLTPVELIERKTVEYKVLTYTPDEMEKLLRAAPDEWLPVVALGGFCGLRPEELYPEEEAKERKKRTDEIQPPKPGLRWEHILWEAKKIDIPAAVSKTRTRRFAVLTDAAAAWLAKWRKASGPIAHNKRFWRYIPKLKKDSGVEWKADALRHSYASYRLAITKDVPALALEMGNSPAMIFRHYLDLKHEPEAIRWFGIRP